MAKNALSKAVVIGGSAGSLDVMLNMLPQLAPRTGAAFIIVLHRKPEADTLLAEILSRKTTMPVREVEDKEPLLPDTVYIAPADYHLLLEDEHSFSLDTSEKVNYSRPSIDVTFESAAEIFGSRSIVVLLSGASADGADGMEKIRAAGGITIAQEPGSADVGFMPQQAIERGAAMYVLLPEEIPGFVNRLLT
jgi:two-component system chemotaxis response regulator CheB